jgi:hypothetical protein
MRIASGNDLILRSGPKGRVSKDGPDPILRDARKSALLRMRLTLR